MTMKRILAAARDERGNVLIIAMLLVFATFIIGTTLAMVTGTDLKISGNQELGTEAQFAADAGLAETIHRLALANPTPVVVNGATINGSIADNTKPYDPNYKAYIMLTPAGASPIVNGSTLTAGTFQDLNAGNVIQYSEPGGTQNVITVQHKWRDVNNNGVRDPGEIVLYDPAKVPPENLVSGGPVDIVTVTGRAGNTKRVIQAEVAHARILAKTLGALYTDKAVKITGSSAFCGWNHDIDTPVGTKPNACFAYHLPKGSLAGVTTTGDVVNQQGAADIEGSPAVTNTSGTNPWYSLAETLGITQGDVNALLADADYTAPAPVMDGICYFQGNATINSNMTGHGLIYCTGNLTVNGGFNYWGLIYVEGDCMITGTPWILGSIMVKGTSDFNFNSGNAAVLYSQDAITEYVGRSMPMVLLAWREK